jgi:hypothetical protein
VRTFALLTVVAACVALAIVLGFMTGARLITA